jgi:hypothetical protein
MGDFFLLFLVIFILWLLWRWLFPAETSQQMAQRLEREARERREVEKALRLRLEAEAESRKRAEALRAQIFAEYERIKRGTGMERQKFLYLPISPDIHEDMRAFIRAGEFHGEENSPLAYVGYRVGKTSKLPAPDRRRRLTACFQAPIPRELADRYFGWGEPATRRRFTSIIDHISMLADMRRTRPNYKTAVAHWDEDADWFRSEYGALAERLGKAGF